MGTIEILSEHRLLRRRRKPRKFRHGILLPELLMQARPGRAGFL